MRTSSSRPETGVSKMADTRLVRPFDQPQAQMSLMIKGWKQLPPGIFDGLALGNNP